MAMIRRSAQPEAFDAAAAPLLSASFFKLAHTPAGAAYYQAAVGPTYVDDSFVSEQAGVTIVVCCDGSSGKGLTRFGSPIEIFVSESGAISQKRQTLRETFGEIRRLAEARGGQALFRTSPSIDPNGLIASALLGAGAAPALEFRAEADLSLNEADLAADMRKGHRQQVRWGQKNLRLVSLSGASVGDDVGSTLRELHAVVAGRVTRPAESWEASHAMVVAGEGGYVLAYLGEELLGGTIALDAGDTSYYATGVYRRDHFDKPIAHACVYAAMLDAKARGRRFFDVGGIQHVGQTTNEKETSIAYFKQGFSSRVVSSVIWSLGEGEPQGH